VSGLKKCYFESLKEQQYPFDVLLLHDSKPILEQNLSVHLSISVKRKDPVFKSPKIVDADILCMFETLGGMVT